MPISSMTTIIYKSACIGSVHSESSDKESSSSLHLLMKDDKETKTTRNVAIAKLHK